MVFSSTTFVFLFLPVTLLLVWVVPDLAKNAVLLAASLVFYAWGEPVYIVLLLANALFNYGIAFAVKKKGVMALHVAVNIGILAVFKYADFILSTLNGLFGLRLPLPSIPLPIGISFFTFQAMSYVIDVYRGNAKLQKRFDYFLLYLSFFPQLIAGPIVKYRDIEDQLARREMTWENTGAGLSRFVVGLSKKLFLANGMAFVVDRLYGLDVNSFFGSWLIAVAYVFQIYFDFSGYSDMAIGLGRVFGFHFKENFDKPLSASGVRDFWHRWHISLSGWFRDYVYFPLGGSRVGPWKTVRNQFIVFFLTGLWHGASWTFVLWGLWHWFFLTLERLILRSKKWPRVVGHVYTLLVVILGFVLFRAPTVGDAFLHLKAMFTPSLSSPALDAALQETATPLFWGLFVVCIVASVRWTAKIRVRENLKWAGVALLWVGCLMKLSVSAYNPFIYFRF